MIDVISRKPFRTLSILGSGGVLDWERFDETIKVYELAAKTTHKRRELSVPADTFRSGIKCCGGSTCHHMKHPTRLPIRIGKQRIGYHQTPFIIAEAGVNHNGRLDIALRLVDAAAQAGADAIKFQTFRAEDVVTEKGEMVAYQKSNVSKIMSQREMLKGLELPRSFYGVIIRHCRQKKILFLSTPHGGFQAVDLLQSLKVPAFKFGSGDLTNLPLLQYAAQFKKPMILGTGMSTLREVHEAIQCIKKTGNRDIVALHCTTNYPCPPNEVNLSAMQTMMNKLEVLVGYSDHTLGTQVPVMAATLGACIIEKHVTLDRSLPGPDHKASATPQELQELVKKIRKIKVILGSAIKAPSSGEKITAKLVRKSIVATDFIPKGEIFSRENIGIKRPGTGIKPQFYFVILGKRTARDILDGTLITRRDYV